ncbi:uroporphyrinogen decarboxylase family protein [Candidatus Formimonas warabiya]|uniref:Uroporphyrinogen decarboxylase (URO-D) domain-containing protein n=1 Tax=Formimonas warabiya TaxID=1761012 RepID=A0A3G1KTS9_FORW1|nr:uroporphyrinogen decarboxylase family protein [Candidatus Formimonas warabiya]ATW25872.1 hypothetical protein DCMF_14815 [Candidatus Formimonas warabiya]
MKPKEMVLDALQGKRGPIPWIEIETRDELIAKTFGLEKVGWQERVKYAKFVGQDAVGIAHWDRFGNEMVEYNGVLGFKPLIKEREDLDKLKIPEEIDEDFLRNRVKEAKEAIGDSGLALFVAHIFCLDPVIIDLGFENFCYKLYEDIDLIKEIMERYTQYFMKLDRLYSSMPEIDFIWVGEDIAFNSGTYVQPELFRNLVLPYFRRMAEEIKKPWIYHSDGNITQVIEDLLTLGMDAIHPIQPDVMDIYSLIKTLGQRTTLIGNVDLTLLTRGTPESVYAEVTKLMETCGRQGRYILSSSNSLANFVHPDNVIAMGKAKRDFLAKNYGL